MDDLHKLMVLLATDDPAYTDLTEDCFDFLLDPAALPLTAAGYLYLGRRKPFGLVYVDVSKNYANVQDTQLTMEYWDGTAWTAWPLQVENTRAFKRPGFIKWQSLVEEGTAGTWAATEVAGSSRFWIRLKVADDLTPATRVNGINLVFADDQDLKRVDFGALAMLPKDENRVLAESHILSHVAARDRIIQSIRNDGTERYPGDGTVEDIDEWDLFRSGQILQAAIFACLSQIYFNASDNPEDIYWKKYQDFEAKFTKAMQLFLLSVDADDNGKEDALEKNTMRSSGRFVRQ